MLVSVLAAALLLPWCHALPAGAAKDAGLAGRQTSCAGVHILIARGTTEEYPGDMITLANLIIANNAGADYEDIIYPATFDYIASTQQGMNATKSQLTAYVEACPESRIVLLGYSQGAHVTGDALCGGGGSGLGAATEPVSTDVGEHVAAAVWYGDPRHVAGQSYDEGTATTSGIYPRTAAQLAILAESYANRIRSYCDDNDFACASGSSVSVHGQYPENYDEEAAAWVQTLL
ncbi:Cutinase [Lasiodiplodia theobromae]|uniref:Acetylxylan esterase n=1 Tax=Lasiodiplodia hormozganensis TaxID=869390 RepID=A0AA40CWC4_9PEZI|nr:Cutinase [Lasiodiplodia theobromae]KAF4542341.1 Cutinase [Lasiodiplodia theobromae]KAF9635804.1 Cutinase [Lasiodiplodia theobromae]KAK0653945.1 Acetylxylan esterase [Lasiodiplodia hormozganensis]